MADALGIAGAVVVLLVGICTLIGLAVRYALMPYLDLHLVQPLRETREAAQEARKQVTENHHSNPRPTVLDRIDDVAQQVAANTRLTADNTAAVDTLARMFDGHLEQAQDTTERFQVEVDRIWAQLRDRREKEDET